MLSSGINPWILLIALSSTIASFAQVLLKMSANEEHKNVIEEYLNWKVIVGYGLMFVGMGLTIVAYAKGVQYKNGPIMESIANIWVVLLSWYFFREPVNNLIRLHFARSQETIDEVFRRLEKLAALLNGQG